MQWILQIENHNLSFTNSIDTFILVAYCKSTNKKYLFAIDHEEDQVVQYSVETLFDKTKEYTTTEDYDIYNHIAAISTTHDGRW